MAKSERYSSEIQNLLSPRDNLPWTKIKGFLSPWARPVLIENKASRAFAASLQEEEYEERLLIRDLIEDKLAAMPAAHFRYWMAEFDFMSKMLNAEQLVVYTPAFIQLSHLMPRKLVFCRRQIVSLYLKSRLTCSTEFIQRQSRKFVRSSVLLYPSSLLFKMADLYWQLALRSVDQSSAANRERVIMSIRALQLMSDTEICARFKKEEEYRTELKFLAGQCRYYRIKFPEIYHVSVEEVQNYWDDPAGNAIPHE